MPNNAAHTDILQPQIVFACGRSNDSARENGHLFCILVSLD